MTGPRLTRAAAAGEAIPAGGPGVIVTVGTSDLPQAWWTQLAPGGRLVVPLRWRGQTRSIAFTLDADTDAGRMQSTTVELCGVRADARPAG